MDFKAHVETEEMMKAGLGFCDVLWVLVGSGLGGWGVLEGSKSLKDTSEKPKSRKALGPGGMVDPRRVFKRVPWERLSTLS